MFISDGLLPSNKVENCFEPVSGGAEFLKRCKSAVESGIFKIPPSWIAYGGGVPVNSTPLINLSDYTDKPFVLISFMKDLRS